MLQVCLSGFCICFTHKLQVFYLDVAYVLIWFQVFFCKCFICLLLYIASVASRCFKSRSAVARVAMAIRACFKCFIFFRRML
jgi:hypothetical protein